MADNQLKVEVWPKFMEIQFLIQACKFNCRVIAAIFVISDNGRHLKIGDNI